MQNLNCENFGLTPLQLPKQMEIGGGSINILYDIGYGIGVVAGATVTAAKVAYNTIKNPSSVLDWNW